MPVAVKLLPLLKDKRVQHALEGIFLALVLLVTAISTMMTGHNLQWYGNNTVAADFAPLVSDTYEKIDEGSLKTTLLYSAYITLFDNGNEYPNKEDARSRLITCFYSMKEGQDENGKPYESTVAIEDDNEIFDRIEDEFGIEINNSKRQYMVGLAGIFVCVGGGTVLSAIRIRNAVLLPDQPIL